MSELIEKIKKFVKILVVIGIVVLIGWGIKKGINRLFQEATEDTTYPETPVATATEFFTNLYNAQYQPCYKLLSTGRKSATVIGSQSREVYYRHFRRIRSYLIERVGNDFIAQMTVSDDGQNVVFRNGVAISLAFDATTSLDKKTHYPLREINEFPIDVMPGMGVEQYNRRISRAIESMAPPGPEQSLDDPAEIVRERPDENPSQRLDRLIDAFQNARQLDTKHTILDWILKEFPHATPAFLNQLANDENAPPHLRQIARNAMSPARRR